MPLAVLGAEPHPAGARLLRRAGFTVKRAGVRNADVFVTYVTVCVEEPLLRLAPKLKAVVTCSAGTDHIDMQACRKRGIRVFNAPGANANSVAEHAIGLMLSVLRRIAHADRQVRAKQWESERFLSTELRGKTVGLIGFGAIGRLVAEKLAGFGVRLLAYDPYVPLGEFRARHVERATDVEALLRSADIVSLHAPLTPETYHLLDRRRLALLRPGAILINTSRGEVVDERALAKALRARLGGAGLDVFESEPEPLPALLGLDNVVLTPHIAAMTETARKEMAAQAIGGFLSWWKRGR